MYIEEAYCDKCGSKLESTGVALTSYPAQYPFRCTNKDCDGGAVFFDYEKPGMLRYEFEDSAEEI